MFRGADGNIIDGLESDEIAHSTDLLSFLTSKVAGLQLKYGDDGTAEFLWRKHITELYIDEIKADAETASYINPTDIAMIKVYEPGVMVSFGSAQGGTIAIYLKNGSYGNNKKPTNHFKIDGYTGLYNIWK